jgi:hypothetical protein
MNERDLSGLIRKTVRFFAICAFFIGCSDSNDEDYFHSTQWEVEEVFCYKRDGYCNQNPFVIDNSNILKFHSNFTFEYTLYTGDIEVANKYGSLITIMVEGNYHFVNNKKRDFLVLRTDNRYLNGIYKLIIVDNGSNGDGRVFKCFLVSPSIKISTYSVLPRYESLWILNKKYSN